eukprot:572850-Rhodomonas_salina.1
MCWGNASDELRAEKDDCAWLSRGLIEASKKTKTLDRKTALAGRQPSSKKRRMVPGSSISEVSTGHRLESA